MDSKEVISFEFLRTAANADTLINSAELLILSLVWIFFAGIGKLVKK